MRRSRFINPIHSAARVERIAEQMANPSDRTTSQGWARDNKDAPTKLYVGRAFRAYAENGGRCPREAIAEKVGELYALRCSPRISAEQAGRIVALFEPKLRTALRADGSRPTATGQVLR